MIIVITEGTIALLFVFMLFHLLTMLYWQKVCGQTNLLTLNWMHIVCYHIILLHLLSSFIIHHEFDIVNHTIHIYHHVILSYNYYFDCFTMSWLSYFVNKCNDWNTAGWLVPSVINGEYNLVDTIFRLSLSMIELARYLSQICILWNRFFFSQ